MTAAKILKLEELSYYDKKLRELFVQKELKTNSKTDLKVLSDNNFSDVYRNQVDKAKDYVNLENKPAIDDFELSSTTTSNDLGLVKKSDLSSFLENKDIKLITSDEIQSLF